MSEQNHEEGYARGADSPYGQAALPQPSPEPTAATVPPASTLCDRLQAYFVAHAGEWIDGRDLARVAGYAAYRNRITDLRLLRKMTIENRQRIEVLADGRRIRVSEYRYVPAQTAAA